MTFSHTLRKLGCGAALGLAVLAVAVPAATGMPLAGSPAILAAGDGGTSDTVVRPSGPAPDTFNLTAAGAEGPFVSGVPGGGYDPTDALGASPGGDSWPFAGIPVGVTTSLSPTGADTVVRPDERPVRPGGPTTGLADSISVAPAPVDVVRPVSDTSNDWRTVAIALGSALAALLAAVLGVGIARRSRQHAQLS